MNRKNFGLWLISLSGLYLVHDFLAKTASISIVNKGVSFGLENGLVAVSIILCALILIWGMKENKLYLWVLLAGGWSNLIDRFRFDSIRDYWKIGETGIYNNINDWVIALAIILFLKEILWKKKSK